MKLAIIFGLLAVAQGLVGPCKQKELGEECSSDYECGGGTLTQCGANNKCQCGDGFQEKTIQGEGETGSEDSTRRICEPAPANEDEQCTTACQSPLLCGAEGQCECVNPTSRGPNNECIVKCPDGEALRPIVCKRAAKLNQECDTDDDCIDPFTTCRSKRCRCQQGTTGSNCQPQCADGSRATQSCRLNYAAFPLILSAADKSDTCPNGQYCASWGNPLIGRCCPLACPYGNPISGKTCRRGASGSSRCGSDGTSFCYAIEGLGQRNALCCPKPCKEPLPYYFNGKCYSKSFRDDFCEINAQCLGGSAMQCRDEKCVCKSGFVEDDSGKFPTCKRDCSAGTVGVGDSCLPVRSSAGESCSGQAQCRQAGLVCRQGTCQCPCGSTFLATGSCQQIGGQTDLFSAFRGFLQG